jgi:hypothetical protein
MMNREATTLAQIQSKFGSECIFFLASFNAIQDYPIHSPNSHLTLFHLSECLTIINAYKGSGERRSLLINNNQKLSGYETGPPIILSYIDLPALETSAALHIIAMIILSKVSLRHRIMADVVHDSLRILFKVGN